jgi:hypothetical protein
MTIFSFRRAGGGVGGPGGFDGGGGGSGLTGLLSAASGSGLSVGVMAKFCGSFVYELSCWFDARIA